MKLLNFIACCLVLCLPASIPSRSEGASADDKSSPASPEPGIDHGFVTRQGNKLFLNGKEFRAIGVNIPHLHAAYFGTWHHDAQIYGSDEKARQAIIDAIVDAEKSGAAFIRFFADPGYPVDTDKLYIKDPAGYWQLMDELFALCHKHHLRLVPSLSAVGFWHSYCQEPTQAILDPASKTSRLTRKYITEFVTRYKDDPTILMWELQNESMLAADVDFKGSRLMPAALFSPDQQPVRTVATREDSLTWDMVLRIYREQAAFIKSLDPNHMVESGDAGVRIECASRRETFPNFKYRPDSWKEYLADTIASQPDPLDLYSLHWGGSYRPIGEVERTVDKSWRDKPFMDVYREMIRAVRASGKPVYIGELSQQKPGYPDDPHAVWTRAFIDMMEAEGGSLASLWVWHFPWQPKLTVSGETQPELMARIAAFNLTYAQMRGKSH
jgi:hypothetical protein